MDKSSFIKYKTIVKLLEDNSYYGFTVGRTGQHRMKHTFVSVKWYTIDIVVEALRLEGEDIVIGIKIDGEEVNGMEAFKERIGRIGKIHAQKRKQNIR
jgi:hypothetical protein